MRQLVVAATLLMLAGCDLSQPALWGAVEGGRLLVGAVGAVVADDLTTESEPTKPDGVPLVTESNTADTKPTEGYDPLNP
jgi:hypothetical protein